MKAIKDHKNILANMFGIDKIYLILVDVLM
jgi:hypothetical protein